MAISRLSIIKFLELILICIILGIHYHSFNNCSDIHLAMLTTGTYVGYIIILIGCAAGYLLQTPINRRIDIFFSLVGCALYVACGALLIQAYENAWHGELRDKQLAKASLSIINGAVFLIDAFLTYRGE